VLFSCWNQAPRCHWEASPTSGAWGPVPGLRHSTGGELVIKQKLVRGKKKQKGAKQWEVGEKAVPTLISGP